MPESFVDKFYNFSYRPSSMSLISYIKELLQVMMHKRMHVPATLVHCVADHTIHHILQHHAVGSPTQKQSISQVVQHFLKVSKYTCLWTQCRVKQRASSIPQKDQQLLN